MSTITHRGLIGKSRITISVQDRQHHRPLTLMPIRTLQRQSPKWVSRNTSSTSFARSQGRTSGKSSWSSWWTKMPRWPPRPMRSSPCSSKRKLQSRERKGSLQKLCSLQRRVAKVVVVVMAVKLKKAAEVQGGIREMTREIIRETTIAKRRISGSAFIASGEGTPPRTAWASNAAILQRLPTLQQSIDWDYFDSHHFDQELLDGGQLKCFIQWLVHQLRMHDSHLRPSINVHHLHWISSKYEEGQGI